MKPYTVYWILQPKGWNLVRLALILARFQKEKVLEKCEFFQDSYLESFTFLYFSHLGNRVKAYKEIFKISAL